MALLPVQIMGILNVTPDSFSDGGQFDSKKSALVQAEAMIAAGADIIDIGGESTRPYADVVTIDDELNRVIPTIREIRQNHQTLISIDTSKAAVARNALSAGADIINDVSALRKDPEMLQLVKETEVPVIIMHMQGTPETMQVEPHYEDVVEEILVFFKERLSWLESHGVDTRRIIIDPGIGFGKKLQHNLSILKHLKRFSKLGQPVLLGHSRKRFIGDITGLEVTERDFPTAIISALALSKKIAMVRVHDIVSTRQAIEVAAAIHGAP